MKKIILTFLILLISFSLILADTESGTTIVRDIDGTVRMLIKNEDSDTNPGARAGIKLLTDCASTTDSLNIYVEPVHGDAIFDITNDFRIESSSTSLFVIDNSGNVTLGHWEAWPIEMSYGGLGTDVSTYSGLYKFNSGSLSQLTTKSGLAGEISDLSHIVEHSAQVDNVAGNYLEVESNTLRAMVSGTITSEDDTHLASVSTIYDHVDTEISGSTHDAVTLSGTPDYITISGQDITRHKLDMNDDTNLSADDGLTLTGNSLDFDGGASPSEDLGGTWAAPTVNDDSHNHVISNIDQFTTAEFEGRISDGGKLDDDDVTSADVGSASPNLNNTDASIKWEDANMLDTSGNFEAPTVFDDDYLYMSNQNTAGSYNEGSWRLDVDTSNNLVWSYFDGATWTEKFRISQ